MSDSVVKAEIEDVLSSIRRLVTEEGRGGPKPSNIPVPADKPLAENPIKATDRLVLTPALRVLETDEGDQTDGMALSDGAAPSDLAPEPEVQASDDNGSEAGPETDDVAPWARPGATLYQAADHAEQTNPPQSDNTRDDDARDAPLTLDLAWVRPASDDADAQNAEPAAEFSESVATSDELLFESSRPASEMGFPRRASRPEDGADLRDLPAAKTPVEDDAPNGELAEGPTGLGVVLADAQDDTDAQDEGRHAAPVDADKPYEMRAASLSAKIEALEAAIAETKDQWEPDGGVGDDYAGTPVDTQTWTSEASAAPDAALSGGTATDDVGRPDLPPALEDTAQELTEIAMEAVVPTGPIDDAALRALVADIVRQELQGALGERITRNVRKLVRREIHRALTAQELE